MIKGIFRRSSVIIAGLFAGLLQASDIRYKKKVNPTLLTLFYTANLDPVNKNTVANALIKSGALRGSILNGQYSDHPTGPLAEYSEELVTDLLKNASTITALPDLLSEEQCRKNNVFDLKGKGLITVRDIEKLDWFDNIKVIDLSFNKLNEIPVRFFELFPNAQRYIFTGNPIKHLDTTYMPHGLEIIADYTKLRSISPVNMLQHNGYLFNIIHTPLSYDLPTLRMYSKLQKNLVTRFYESCRGKNIDQEESMSTFITQ